MKTRSRMVTVALALVSTAAGASTISASITNLKFSLIDLDPDDGQAPFYKILSGPQFSTHLWLRSYTSSEEPRSVRSRIAFDDLEAFGRKTGADFALVDGDASLGGRTRSWRPIVHACNDCRLVVSRQTRLVISGDYALSATSTWRAPGRHPDYGASAWVKVAVRNPIADVITFQQAVSVPGLNLPPPAASAQGSFSLAFDNNLSHRNRDLYISVGAGGDAHAQRVPEPGTYALMAAGLVGIGSWARRRTAMRRA